MNPPSPTTDENAQFAGRRARISELNVEIVRRYASAFNRRDVDRMLQFYDPEAEVFGLQQ